MNPYRYLDEGRNHIHQLWSVLPSGEEAWQPLIGSSTIAKESINKGDGLMQWFGDHAALAALGKPMPEGLMEDYDKAQLITDRWVRADAMRRIDKKYPDFANARRAAIAKRDASGKKGTERHGVLEAYVKKCILENNGAPIRIVGVEEWEGIEMFILWSCENVKRFSFAEAHCYSKRLWLGGIADIGLEMKDGRRLVGDHKSSKSAFFDQFIQCALYDIELAENGGLDRDGNHLFDWQPADGFVVFPFRSNPFTPEFKWNVDEYRSVAEGVVRTYKLKEYDHV